MKKIHTFHKVAVCVVLSFSLICLNMVFSLSAESLTLTYASDTAPTGYRGTAEKIFLEELEKAAGGELTIKPFWTEALLNQKEILKGIEDGIVDMGLVNIIRSPKRLIRNTGMLLVNEGPIKYLNRIKTFKRIYQEVPELTGEIQKHKQRTVYIYNLTTTGIFANKPISNIGDIKQIKITSASPFSLAILKDLGSIPVSIPWADVYISLQTNSIQGLWSNADGYHRVKLYEIAPHAFLTERFWVPVPHLINISERTWQKLTPKMINAFETAALNAVKRFARYESDFWDRMMYDMKTAGATIVNASDADYNTILNVPAQEKNIKYWAKMVKKGGVKNAPDLIKKIKQIVAEEVEQEKR